MRGSRELPGGALLIIADGLAEPEGSHSTLASADTPNLDRLARLGRLFRLDPQRGASAEETTSERGISALLGLGDPREEGAFRVSRGGLLALLSESGRNDPWGTSSWFYVATPARFGPDGTLLSYVNDPERESSLWTALLDRLPPNPEFVLLPVRAPEIGPRTGGGAILRMVAAFPGPLTLDGTASPGQPPRSGKRGTEALRSEGLCGWFSRECRTLFSEGSEEGEPGLWLWGGGERPDSSPVPLPGRFLVAQAPLVRALGKMAGYDTLPLFRATGETDTDLSEKLLRTREALAQGASRVVLHIEGFDMASHRRDPLSKRAFLERFDREVLGPLVEALRSGEVGALGITSDHQSSPRTGNHEAGPVPALLVRAEDLQVLRPDDSSDPVRGGGRRMTEESAADVELFPIDRWNFLLFSDRQPSANPWPDGGREMTLTERTPCRVLS